jgi:hypothetical protein
MRRLYAIAFSIFMLFILTSAAPADDMKLFASDSVGIKLMYPSGWQVDEFRWGFTLMERTTQATVTVRAQYFPKEFEKAYDVDLNPEFALAYNGKFEELESGEKQVDGLTWDYTSVKGAKGSAMEYIQETYSLLKGDSFYSIELYYNTSIADKVTDDFKKILDSVKLMYRDGELPLATKYKKEWDSASKEKKPLSIASPSGNVVIEYTPPWIYGGSGSGTETGLHYISGDPYLDFDMVLVKHEIPDPKMAITSIQGWVGMLTDNYTPEEEGTVTFNNNDYFYRKLIQGSGDHIIHTWMYSTKLGNGTLIFVFAYHDKAKEKAQETIENLMKGVTIKKGGIDI